MAFVAEFGGGPRFLETDFTCSRKLPARICATSDAPDASRGDDEKPKPTSSDSDNAGLRREPELAEHEEIVSPARVPQGEFDFDTEEDDGGAAQHLQQADQLMVRTARNASLDPDDGMAL